MNVQLQGEGNEHQGDSIVVYTLSNTLREYLKLNMTTIPHAGVSCNICLTESIKGSLFTCLECPDFMACENCGKSGKHHHSLFATTSKYIHYSQIKSRKPISLFNHFIDLTPPPTKLKVQLQGEAQRV